MVVYSVVEERDETGDADDGERLDAEDGENDGGESGGEECFVYTEKATGVVVHIEGEGEGGEEVYEIYADGGLEGFVVWEALDGDGQRGHGDRVGRGSWSVEGRVADVVSGRVLY